MSPLPNSRVQLPKSLPPRAVRRRWLHIPTIRLTWRHKIAAFVWFSIIVAIATFALRGWVQGLGSRGYVGAFLINGLSSATVVLPAPGAAAVIVMARDLSPFWLGVASGLGGALGSLTAYLVGAQSREVLQNRRGYRVMCRLMDRGGHLILFFFALMPFLPMDFASIAAGAARYPIKRYLLYVGPASVIKMVAILYGTNTSLDWLYRWLQSWV